MSTHKRVTTSVIYISGNFGLGSVSIREWDWTSALIPGNPPFTTHKLLTLAHGICTID